MARPFHAIFAGLDDSYGTYVVPRNPTPDERGKIRGTAKTVAAPVTVELYTAHLNGQDRGLGIVPVRRDGTCMWFCIDIDDYQGKKPEDWSKEIEKKNLPLIVCRSKSGGTHLFGFLVEPGTAKLIREIMKKYLKILKLPSDTETFPLQDALRDSQGSWVNLPYYGDTRCAVHQGRDLSLGDFLQLVHAKEAFPDNFVGAAMENKDGKVAPPCIDRMEEDGVDEGGRDSAIFHVGVYLHKRYGDDFEAKLVEWNYEHCSPPKDLSEVGRIINSIKKKEEYHYKCKVAPMMGLCDAAACRRREFGIGDDTDVIMAEHVINRAVHVQGEPKYWRVEIDGSQVNLLTEEFISFGRFQAVVARELGFLMPGRSAGEWSRQVGGLMHEAVQEAVPMHITAKGQIFHHFEEWTSAGCAVTTEIDRVTSAMPWFDQDSKTIVFLDTAFLSYAASQQKEKLDMDKVWAVMQERGCEESTRTINGKRIKVWEYPVDTPWFDMPLTEDHF